MGLIISELPYRAGVRRIPWAEEARMLGDYKMLYQDKRQIEGMFQGSVSR